MRNQFRGFFVHDLPASLPYASIADCLAEHGRTVGKYFKIVLANQLFVYLVQK